MANSKISALSAKAIPIAADSIAIVDSSDTSSKKCTFTQLLTGGTAWTIGKTAVATTIAGTAVVSEGLTVTAGGITSSDGTVSIVDNANNAQALLIQNDTITTFGNGTTEDAGMVVFSSDTMTTGDLLRLQLDESALNGGAFLKCVQTDGPTIVFVIRENGATTITGEAAGTGALTLTAGDLTLTSGHAVLTLGNLTLTNGATSLTRASNAVALTVTNNSATSASVVVLAGSGTFTGNTTSSWMTITPSGLTSGTAVYLPLAVMANGKGLHIAGTATQTTGTLLYVQSTGANGALTSGTVATFDETATAITGTVNNIGSNLSITSNRTVTSGTVADDFDLCSIIRSSTINGAGAFSKAGSVLYIQNVTTNTSGTITDTTNGVEIVMDALGTGDGVKITHSAIAGKALNIISAVTTGTSALITTAALTQGKTLSLVSGATQTTGSLLYVQNTGASSAMTSGTVATFDHTSTAIAASVNKIGSVVSITSNRTVNTGGTTADDFDLLSLVKATTRTAGTAASAGSVLYVEVQCTGTMTEASNGIEMVMDSGGTGDAIKITQSAVTGKAVNVISSADTAAGVILVTANSLTSGQIVSIASSATGIATTGRLFLSNHSGATGTTAILNEFKSAANDETTVLQVLASDVLAGGVLCNLSGAAVTTGTILNIIGLSALTTGTAINVVSASADTGTRTLVNIVNDNAAATGTTALAIQQDADKPGITITGLTTIGIDFTALGVADSLFDCTATTDTTMKAPQTDACTGFFKIDVAGAPRYVPFYTST
jgi:hypothetical protein